MRTKNLDKHELNYGMRTSFYPQIGLIPFSH